MQHCILVELPFSSHHITFRLSSPLLSSMVNHTNNDIFLKKKSLIIKDLQKILRSFLKLWRHGKNLSSSKSGSSPKPKSNNLLHPKKPDAAADANIQLPYQFQDSGGNIEIEEKSMHGVHSFRSYNGDAVQRDYNPMSINKGLLKKQSSDHHFFPGVPSPLSRSTSRSTTPLRSTSSRKNPDLNGFPASLSRNSSRRSTTPIMFSNSTGMIKPPPIEKQLECTLEELCYGCTKKIKITRDVITSTGQIIQEEEMLTIKVKPGWKKGTKVTFEGMGNEKPGTLPADVTFVIAEKRHSLFRREGDDLELAVEIPLVKALTGCSLSIPLLGGEKMNLKVDEIIHPGFHRLIACQGMPVDSIDYGKRGNLKVVFLIDFPKQLTEEQRLDILSIL